MKIFKILFILFCFISGFNAQMEPTVKFKMHNNTGKEIFVTQTIYLEDTTKQYSAGLFCIDCSSERFFYDKIIRIDCYAVETDTQDTTFSKSFYSSSTISIEKNIRDVEPPIKMAPRLIIKASRYRRIINIGEPINLKLINNEKVFGDVINYNQETITILNKANQKIEVQPKDIKSIKYCSHLFSYGARISMFHRCKYGKIHNVKFKLVEQKFNVKKTFWEWVEI